MPAPKGNQYALNAKSGRPTKYKPEYCEEIIKYFSVKPNKKEITAISQAYKKGEVSFEKKEYKLVPNELPTITKFCEKKGIAQTTLLEWANEHKEFSLALNRAKELYKNFLVENGLLGLYNSIFAIFVAKNTTDMKDKIETDIEAHLVIPIYGGRKTIQEYHSNQENLQLESKNPRS